MTRRDRHRPTVIATAICLVVLALGAGPAPASAASPQKVLSHFLCYRGTFSPAFAGVPGVVLEDVLGSSTVTVLKSNIWCNPVEKRRLGKVTKIVDPDQHLKSYPVQAPGTDSRDLLVTNQFGVDQKISINIPPSHLLVPTKMPPHARPRGLDHFDCHNVNKSDVLDKTVRLHDEFDRYRLKLSQQWLQCVPTAKTHGSAPPTQIRHANATLACYLVEDLPSGRRRAFKTINQFEPRSVQATVDASFTIQLCVPSRMELVP